MDLYKKKILFAANYAAPYRGNFILSLDMLRQKLQSLYSVTCAYLLPAEANKQDWIEDFAKDNKLYFSGKSLSSGLDEIIADFKPDMVYSHFEGYDLPLYRTLKRCGKPVRQVWHMHDNFTFHQNPIKALYQGYCFFKHYGLPFWSWGVKPCIIAVCEHERRFIRPYRCGKPILEDIIPNGISLQRIIPRIGIRGQDSFTFLAFGGRNIQKRADYLVEASKSLTLKGIKHNIIITGSPKAKSDIENICGKLPDNIKIIYPREDINSIFSMADCFVSTSVRETFSYAIAEALYFGLPVIQSNIEGTRWSESFPSTYIFKSGNVEELASCMAQIISYSPDELKKLCEISSQLIVDNFSLDAWAENIIRFFEKIP